MKKILILAILLIVIIAIAGCSQQPTGQAIDKLQKTGKTTSQPTQEESTTTHEPSCNPDWQCSEWSECSKSGTQTRKCVDKNDCETKVGKPTESQSCVYKPKTFNIGDILSNKEIEFIVHSIRKTYYISEYDEADEGKVYLIVDFSIKNIGDEDGYYFNPNNIEVEDENHYTYSYSWDSYNLDKYFDDTTVELGRTKRGEIAFEVPKISNKFIFILKSGFLYEREIALVDLGAVPNPPEIKSATLTIDTVDYFWYDYGMIIDGKTGLGSISSIDVFIENTGTMAITPKYDVLITHGGGTVFSKSSVDGFLIYSGIQPNKKESDTISLLMVSIDSPGAYTVKVDLKNKGEDVIIASSTKDIIIG